MFTRRAEKNKNDFEVNLLKAFIHRKQKKFSETIYDLEAMRHYLAQLHPTALTDQERQTRTEKINEKYALLYNDIASHLFELKEYKDAVQFFKEAKQYKINDVGILCNIGDCALVERE